MGNSAEIEITTFNEKDNKNHLEQLPISSKILLISKENEIMNKC